MYPTRLLQRTLLLALPLAFTACTFPPLDFSRPETAPLELAPGASKSVDFFTASRNLDTGILLQEGTRYSLDIVTLSHWIDGDIETNEDGEPLDQRGFSNALMPFAHLGTFRRSPEHRWFELMLYQKGCKGESLRGISELAMDESSGSYQFVAPCDGRLTLFVNDSYGFYGNNAGYANIALSRSD